MTDLNLFVADAFTSQAFSGNPAGVAPLTGGFPSPETMRHIAMELRHSETAFVLPSEPDGFTLRYFTPEGEVDLCGHATIAAFTILREEQGLAEGTYAVQTRAGRLAVEVTRDRVWLTMAQGRLLQTLDEAVAETLYHAYGLSLQDRPEGLFPCVVSTGLADILLPVSDRETLARATQNREQVIALSRALNVVGVHMYCLSPEPGVTAACRNFAPLYGIDEESATGTATGALTFHLHSTGRISRQGTHVFHQGASLGRPSVIESRIREDGTIAVGGDAVVVLRGTLRLTGNAATGG